jgi:hypothetical protein
MKSTDVANSGLLYTVAIITVLFILAQSLFFLIRAWNRGKALGVPKEQMMKAMRSSAIFTVVPTLPIIIALFTMVKGLGIPVPWIRLSVIGSASYELIAADTAAKSMGLAKGIADSGMSAAIFTGVMWVMMIGIIWGLLFIIFGLKKLFKGVSKVNTSDRKWGEIMINSLFMGMLATFLGSIVTPQIKTFLASPGAVTALIPILVLFASAGIMALFTWLAKRFKPLAWLDNFSMALSMVLAMGMAVFFNSLMGGV